MENSVESLKELATSVIDKEEKAVARLKTFVDDNFIEILQLIFNSKGRLIIAGIGKSANPELVLYRECESFSVN